MSTSLRTAHTRLSISDVTPIAYNLAYKLTTDPAEVEELVQLALIAFWDAEKRPTASRAHLEKPYADARLILQRAMYRHYFPQYYRKTSTEISAGDQASLEVLVSRGGGALPTTPPLDDELELREYLTALEAAHGKVARLVAENLIAPCGECARRILELVDAKAQAARANGRRVRARGTGKRRPIRLSAALVRTALDIPPHRWAGVMRDVRSFTREWLGSNAT